MPRMQEVFQVPLKEDNEGRDLIAEIEDLQTALIRSLRRLDFPMAKETDSHSIARFASVIGQG